MTRLFLFKISLIENFYFYSFDAKLYSFLAASHPDIDSVRKTSIHPVLNSKHFIAINRGDSDFRVKRHKVSGQDAILDSAAISGGKGITVALVNSRRIGRNFNYHLAWLT